MLHQRRLVGLLRSVSAISASPVDRYLQHLMPQRKLLITQAFARFLFGVGPATGQSIRQGCVREGHRIVGAIQSYTAFKELEACP